MTYYYTYSPYGQKPTSGPYKTRAEARQFGVLAGNANTVDDLVGLWGSVILVCIPGILEGHS